MSQLAAPALARRIGLVNTMVFTHIPASLCLIGAAFAPSLEIALGLLLVRSLLSQMDVPAAQRLRDVGRHAGGASCGGELHRGAAQPCLGGQVRRSPARCSPAGAMAPPLIACGVLKIAYDLALFAGFRHVAPRSTD